MMVAFCEVPTSVVAFQKIPTTTVTPQLILARLYTWLKEVKVVVKTPALLKKLIRHFLTLMTQPNQKKQFFFIFMHVSCTFYIVFISTNNAQYIFFILTIFIL
jgi:hypothetical protein